MSAVAVVHSLVEAYSKQTSTRIKLIDAYLGYILLTGAIQFLYCALVGTFPFNSFLSGFISCVGSFILTTCLRLQVSSIQTKSKSATTTQEFGGITEERAFADFLLCNVILHLVVMNFMG